MRRVEGGDVWVAFAGGEEYSEPISITRNVYEVRARRKWREVVGPLPSLQEEAMVDDFVEVAGEVTPACALIYIRRVEGAVVEALDVLSLYKWHHKKLLQTNTLKFSPHPSPRISGRNDRQNQTSQRGGPTPRPPRGPVGVVWVVGWPLPPSALRVLARFFFQHRTWALAGHARSTGRRVALLILST